MNPVPRATDAADPDRTAARPYWDEADFPAAVAEIGGYLRRSGYRFTTVTPATHQRVLTRDPKRQAQTLRDVFGWNLPGIEAALPQPHYGMLARSRLLLPDHHGLVRSRIRFATVDDRIYVHDSFPTTAEDAVFFGPDTYRFIAAVRRHLRPCALLVDLCAGSGVGGLEFVDRCERVVLADISPKATAFAEANRLLSGRAAIGVHRGDLLEGLAERPDAIIANPPYLADPRHRIYRDGGGSLGSDLSVRIVERALDRLAPGGQLILYTGAPVIDGRDAFITRALPLATAAGATVGYEELDPDVFGEELDLPAYRRVERIAATVLVLTMPG